MKDELPDRLNGVKVGDVIEGPWGFYELRVTEIDHDYGLIEGVYTKVPERGYEVGHPCRYLISDWKRPIEKRKSARSTP